MIGKAIQLAAGVLVVVLCAGPVLASGATDFSRYKVILERMPFGAEAPPAPLPGQGPDGQPLPPAESFTKNLKMCAVTRHALTGRLQVGLVDSASKKNYFIAVGDSEDGITVVEADYDGEKALLRKGEQEAWLSMSDVASMAAITGAAPAPGTPGRPALPPAMGGASGVPAPPMPVPRTATAAPTAPGERYASEREAVLAARRARLGVTNALSGDALKKHLEQYQMDLIRSGGTKGPPLPMQLTPEMDAQLVKEGVLPPP